MKQNAVEPLFVLGKHRSGTTWLANQLCEHPLIAGVQHEHHRGSHASHYFSVVQNRYGNLTNKANFIEFAEAMSVSSTFQFMEVDKDFLYSLWPTSYEDLFRIIMTVHAEKQGACYWLDKTNAHTPLVREIAQKYPDAKFIGIIRDIEEVVQSTFGRYSKVKQKKYEIVRNVLAWTQFNKAMLNFAKTSDRIHIVHYENLKRDMQSVMMGVCGFLNIEFDKAMLRQAYRSNTTFHSGKKREEVLSSGEKKLVRWVTRVSCHMPLAMLNSLSAPSRRSKARKALPEWFFSTHPLIQMSQSKSGK